MLHLANFKNLRNFSVMKRFIAQIAFLMIAIATIAQSPIVIYGPDVSIEGETRQPRALPSDCIATELCEGEVVRSNSRKAYILFNDRQIIELSSYTTLKIEEQLNVIYVDSGVVTIHFKNPPDTSDFTLITESARIRYPGADSSWIRLANSIVLFEQSALLSGDSYRVEISDWFEKSTADAQYLFELVESEKIPAQQFRFKFPSQRPPPFRHRARNQGGVATYGGERYYYGGWLYRVDIYRLRIVYNLWFAMSSKGRFYSEAWDEWSDLLDNIHYIELFRPQDPFYIRAGMIENLTFGHGLLVDNYSNAVFPPFEKKSGIRTTLNLKNTRTELFVNDIAYPRLMGLYFRWDANRRFSTDFTFAGDLDQLVGIKDSDRDGFPDRIDPQPDVYNPPDDSIFEGNPPQSLRDIEHSSIYGVAFGMRYQFLRDRYFMGRLSGEIAGLTNTSMGITFPNIALGYRWVRVHAGLDFQTPRFQDGIFDRNYEADKARWVEEDDGNLTLITRGDQLSETEGWLYGWNNGLSINVPNYATLRTRFRDIYREDTRDKHFALTLNIDYAVWEYINGASFFIEQKNVSQIFRRKTDGQNWGMGLEVQPHHTITVKLRYRERYEDKNQDGDITSSEISRSFDGNASIDGRYWWKKFREWWKSRK